MLGDNMNKQMEDLMYHSGLTAQGCWDEMDDYDRKAIEKFAELIVRECIKELEAKGISRKRAKESARFYLPYGIQITCDIMFNWRSFAHFQKLRNEQHAQVEIQDIAKQMLSLVEQTGAFTETIHAMRIAGLLPNREQ